MTPKSWENTNQSCGKLLPCGGPPRRSTSLSEGAGVAAGAAAAAGGSDMSSRSGAGAAWNSFSAVGILEGS